MDNKPYLSVWLLLAAALAVVFVISLADDITLGGWTVKKAPIAEALWGGDDEDSGPMADAAESLAAVAAEVQADPVPDIPLDTTAQTFLLIGDSMTPNMARRLSAYARLNGHNRVHAVNWDASTTVMWAESDRIDNYISEFHPTFIFVCLGSNEAYLKKPEVRRRAVREIVGKFGSIPYVWVGPPSLAKESTYSAMLLSVLGSDHFFYSEGMELERGADNIHPVQSASDQWMDSVISWLPRAGYRFMAHKPERGAKADRIDLISFGPPGRDTDSIAAADSIVTPLLPPATADSIAVTEAQDSMI